MKNISIDGVDYPTYATVEEADVYFKAVFKSNWQNIDPEDKARLLVSATRKIDRGNWKGTKKDPEQETAFPRIIYGKETDEKILMQACCEEAGSMHVSGSVIGADTTGIQSMRVQDTEITFKANTAVKEFQSDATADLLKPYMNTGTRILY